MTIYPAKSHRAPFTRPARSVELAEFCGIMLGDGCLAAYQATVTLHKDEEKEYGAFVATCMKELFGIHVGLSVRQYAKAFSLVLSRIGIVEFLVKDCGLVQGNKITQQIDIPTWIKEDASYLNACMRGLFDTDGSVFTHRYISKGKEYSYTKLSFTSVSQPLLQSVQEILKSADIKARFGSRHDVRVDSKRDVQRYFELFGTHNPKHLRRYGF